MTLNEFIEGLKKDYKLQKSVDQIRQIIISKAHKEAKGNCAVIDDDTIKDWIINADTEAVPEKPIPAAVTTAKSYEEYKATIKEKYAPKKVIKPEKKDDGYEQITLFDL